MPGDTAVDTTAVDTTAVDTTAVDARHTFRAMATDVTMWITEPSGDPTGPLGRARDVFARVETACTRFDPDSPLMRANAAPRHWHVVPDELFQAVREADLAYRRTSGRFDPRVLAVLRAWGYDTSLPVAPGPGRVARVARPARVPGRRAWRPGLDPARSAVRLGPDPIDLGGIGKGLAVRWAARELIGAGRASLVEAGGDLYATGTGPDGTGWRVAVEDPRGGTDPVAVLTLTDRACATSSVRVRRWRVAGRDVHHLIDPRTGRTAGPGLPAVTVVAADPATAEVWSKSLFVAGRTRIRAEATGRGLAALWVDQAGRLGTSPAMAPYLTWQATP